MGYFKIIVLLGAMYLSRILTLVIAMFIGTTIINVEHKFKYVYNMNH